jgi:hypothetical protein
VPEIGALADDVAGSVFLAGHAGSARLFIAAGDVEDRVMVGAGMDRLHDSGGAGGWKSVRRRNGGWLGAGSASAVRARILAGFDRPHEGADLAPGLGDLVLAAFVETPCPNFRDPGRSPAVSDDEVARRAG